jgi:tetratricopeptide (TPR) repeat protein
MGHLGRDHETALSAIGSALAVNPSCAAAHYFGAQINAFCGDSAAATAHADRALRLSPLDSLVFVAHFALGLVAMHEGRYDAAATCFARAAPGRPNFLFYQAVALALHGRMEEAGTIAKRALEERPDLRLHLFYQLGVISEIADKIAAGWRLLGLPE